MSELTLEPTLVHRREACVRTIRLRWLSTPLERPYVSSLGITSELNSVMAFVELDDGRTGFAEVTPIPGYCDETVDGVWHFVDRLAPEMLGRQPHECRARLDRFVRSTPYGCSPLVAALERALLSGSPVGAPVRTRIPLAAAVLSHDETAMLGEVDGLLDAGFRTLRVKAGMDLPSDGRRLRLLIDRAGSRAQFRIDFNGALDYARSMRFMEAIGPTGIDYIEQPCPAEDWVGNARVAANLGIPVALDESVASLDDVRRMVDCGVFAVFKVKLGKFPSIDDMHEALSLGRTGEMKGVVGNGAATDIACWIEATVAAAHDLPPSEMNGFAKNRVNYLAEPLRIESGALVLNPGRAPSLDWDQIDTRSRNRRDLW